MLGLLTVGAAFVLTLGCSENRGPEIFPRIGQPAPEIVGTDLENKPMKLSDYRGKVVVLDFWASWCPPCRAMFPHNRHMIKQYQDKPFAFLGVNCDEVREEALAFKKEANVNWRSFFEGDHAISPVVRKWGIIGFPTVFVIDARGVIRYKDVHGEELDRAVEKLIKEAEKTKA